MKEKKQKHLKEKKKSSKLKVFFKTILILFILGVVSGATLLYGPWHGFRDWLITTAMTTLSHQWMATIFYSDETIQNVLDNNAVIETGATTNTEEVEIVAVVDEEVYENEYEEAILKKDEGNELYKVIDIKGEGYTDEELDQMNLSSFQKSKAQFARDTVYITRFEMSPIRYKASLANYTSVQPESAIPSGTDPSQASGRILNRRRNLPAGSC